MALTNTKRWVRSNGLSLTTDEKLLLFVAVTADIKEARPTVRAKRPVQQAKGVICPRCHRQQDRVELNGFCQCQVCGKTW